MFFTRAWLSIEWASQLLRQVGVGGNHGGETYQGGPIQKNSEIKNWSLICRWITNTTDMNFPTSFFHQDSCSKSQL